MSGLYLLLAVAGISALDSELQEIIHRADPNLEWTDSRCVQVIFAFPLSLLGLVVIGICDLAVTILKCIFTKEENAEEEKS